MTDLYPSCLIQHYQLKFNYKQKSHEINVAVFLDKSFPTAISSVNVAVLSFPIQHIQKPSESTQIKWKTDCFPFMLPFLFTSTTQLSEVRITKSILINRIEKKHSMKKKLAIVRLNYNLFIFV